MSKRTHVLWVWSNVKTESNIFLIADGLEVAAEEDGGRKRERKPESESLGSVSRIEADILQSYGQASYSNATWHNVDVNQESLCVCFSQSRNE